MAEEPKIMNTLEAKIRARANQDFRQDMRQAIINVKKKHKIMESWITDEHGRALDTAIVNYGAAAEKQLGDRAVDDFLAAYAKLIVDFPQMMEDAHELGVEDGIRSSS